MMFVFKALVFVPLFSCFVNAVPVVFKESTPNGESIVSISSSDPNVEKYFTEQFSTRSGFKQVKDDANDNHQGIPGTVRSSISIAVPGKAVASGARSFASASSGPFLPLFAFPINPDFSFNSFPDLKQWVRNIEGYYDPNFAGSGQVNSATAINDNGHVYGKVNGVSFDNRAKNLRPFDNRVQNKQ